MSRLRIGTSVMVALLVAVMCAGCISVTAPDAPPPSANGAPPTPPGLQSDPSSQATTQTTCNAVASLRPDPLPPAGKMPPGSSMERIFQRGRLVVGLDVGSNLFSFRDTVTGQVEGFDVDIAKEIARAIFNDPERIEYRILDSGERVAALQQNQVDIVVKTMSITCERRQEVAFSTVYYEASQRILVPRTSKIAGPDDLNGKRVCMARGTTSIGRIQRLVPNAHIISAANWADCMVVLQQGQVDAISTDDAILAGMAAQDPTLEVVGPSLGIEPYGIGINKDNPQLVRFTNGVLDELRGNGRWVQIYNRWLSVLGMKFAAPQPIYAE